MDRLPTSAKHLLQVAAVIGENVPLPLLEGVTPLTSSVLQQSLVHLRTAGFLYETYCNPHLVYAFTHVLTQEVAYQSLLVSSRQPYHYQIAQLLLERFPSTAVSQPERVAYHYTEAGYVEKALPYWLHAGEQAVARSANHEAMSHFTKGLDILKSLPETSERNQQELSLQLGLSATLYMINGPAPEVEQIYQRVLELSQKLQDDARYFSGLGGLWRFFFNKGEIEKAQVLGQRCFALAQPTRNPFLLSEAHLMLGSTCLLMGDLSTARSHLQRGASLYDSLRAHAQIARQVVDPGIMCLCREAWALWLLGYADQALLAVNRATALAKTVAHAFDIATALFYAAIIHVCRREVDAVHEYAEALLALASEKELIHFVPAGLYCQGWVLAEQGAPEQGLDKFCEGLSVWQSRGIAASLTGVYVALAEISNKCGDIAAGLRSLDEAQAIIETYSERYYEAEAYRLRGELLLHPSIDAPEQSEACFEQARDIAVRQHAKAWELRAAMSLCRLWQQKGCHQAARRLLEPVYNGFTEGLTTPDLLDARALLEVLRGQA